MFLTRNELIDLTGYHRPAFVVRWLQSHGYRYDIGADGWPRVLRAMVNARLGAADTHYEPQINFA